MNTSTTLLQKFRFVLGFFIIALVLSGVTAFPLRHEMEWLVSALGLRESVSSGGYNGLGFWIRTVYDGLNEMYSAHPWIAYGTDWLAFAHVIIAIFFIGPFLDPVKNVWTLKAGLIACLLIVPLAMICGPIRGIPFGWRLIDCSFGVFGAIPLWYCLRVARKMEEFQNQAVGADKEKHQPPTSKLH